MQLTAFDFTHMAGPEQSRRDNFSSMCSRLVMKLHPDAKPVQGSGGDDGVDTFLGVFHAKVDVFQHKFFLETLGKGQRQQVKRSLDAALLSHHVGAWTLMLPKDLTPAELTWFDELRKAHPGVKLDWWGKTKIQQLLAESPEIAADYRAPPTVAVIITGTSLGSGARPEDIALAVRDALGSTNAPDPVLLALAREIHLRSTLRILVWGPSASGGDLYEKRVQIKQRLELLGHTVHFSEDVWTSEHLKRSGLNITVAEYIQASCYDFIVCLMASAGSIAEVHDFAKERAFAGKMMICADASHKSGYSANGALTIFEGMNGKLDWFTNPTDLIECHLTGRVLEHVEKVRSAKQWEQRGRIP